MQEVAARLKNARLSPQKARLIVDQIRGMPVENALHVLTYSGKKGAEIIKKVLRSAISNAEHNHSADIDALVVSSIYVDQGPTLKRLMPRAKGRSDRIHKPMCHITVKVAEAA